MPLSLNKLALRLSTAITHVKLALVIKYAEKLRQLCLSIKKGVFWGSIFNVATSILNNYISFVCHQINFLASFWILMFLIFFLCCYVNINRYWNNNIALVQHIPDAMQWKIDTFAFLEFMAWKNRTLTKTMNIQLKMDVFCWCCSDSWT